MRPTFTSRPTRRHRSACTVSWSDSSLRNTGTLAASLSYNLTKNVSLNFDALNLNDPVLKYYGANKDQPRAFYANGRQYYFTVRIKL